VPVSIIQLGKKQTANPSLGEFDEAQAARRKANPQMAQYYYHYYHYYHYHHHHHYGYGYEGDVYRAPPVYDYGYNYGYGGSSGHDRRMQIIWCTQHPGRC
jgi:hypothetical protein